MIEEQNKNQLPKDWMWVKLGEVCEKIVDGSHNPPRSKEAGLPMLSAKDIFNNKIFFDEPRLISEDEFLRENRRTNINPGNILLTIVATIGRTAVVPIMAPKFTLQRSVAVLKTIQNPYFFCYAFQTPKFQKQLRDYAKGTAQKGVYLKTLSQLEIPLPPKLIQQAIVSKIEELFSELDKGIENLHVAQQQLKTYRQSLLKWAFDGTLTKEWREKNESQVRVPAGSHELTMAAEAEISYSKINNLPKGWKWVKLGEVCSSVEYGSAKKSKQSGKVPVLRMGNIQNGTFDWNDLVYTDDPAEIEKYLLKKNDILFNRTNSAELVGKTAIYKGERPAIFAGYLIRINTIKTLIDSDYLTYFLNTYPAKQYGSSVRSFGVNQSNINGTKLKTYPIPLTTIKEQQEIVLEIEYRLSLADKMEESIWQSLQQAEALRQSILKEAFEGLLVE